MGQQNLGEQNWAEIRARYPAAWGCVFLNNGSRGLLSRGAHRAGIAALDRDLEMSANLPPSQEELALARRLFAQIITAQPDEIAITKNVSEGLNIIGNAIDWRQGDNVVLCSELEHANNVYVWHGLKRLGVEVRDVQAVNGAIDPAAIAAAVTPRTRLVTASSVTFVPGFRTDLQSISAIAREAGALFLVDGVQSCGILRVDVEDLGIDALATSTSKGLLGLRGLGFLYVRQNWIERLHPAYVARNSFETGARHYSEYEGTDVVLKASAQRFECGNYNYTGVAVANAAMTDILKIGTSAIEARAVSLAASLAEALRRMGFVVNTPPHGTALTHLVTLRDPQLTASQSAVSGRLDIFSRELSAANVRFAVRRGMIRFGFHLYNDETDVEVVSAVAAKTIRAAA